MGLLKRVKARRQQTKAEKEAKRAAQRVEDAFANLKEHDGGTRWESEERVLGPAAVEAFCAQLGLDPAALDTLVLCFIMETDRMGFITREELDRGMGALEVTSLCDLKVAVEKERASIVSSRDRFQDLVAFAFDFCLSGPSQKVIELPEATAMLEILYSASPLRERKWTDSFVAFLTSETCTYKALNRDMWESWPDFLDEFASDIASWSDDGPYPLLFNDFVSTPDLHPTTT